MFGIDDMAMATGLSAVANLGGGLFSSAGQAAANSQNVAMQNAFNQQTLNAQQAQHEQNTAFMEDSQAFTNDQLNQSQTFNAHQAELARNFASQQADKSRELQQGFQERMASTQYQRVMRDMKLAGLNPILAYQQGGAAAPAGSGAQASGPAASSSPGSAGMASAANAPHLSAPTVQNQNDGISRALGSLVSSAVQAAKSSADIDLIKANEKESGERTRRVGYETSKIDAETGKAHADTNRTKAEERYIDAQTTNAKIDAAIKAAEAGNMGSYGTRNAPDTLERMLRLLQGAATEHIVPRLTGK